MKRKIPKVLFYGCYIASIVITFFISGYIRSLVKTLANINLEIPTLNTYLVVCALTIIVTLLSGIYILLSENNSKTK